MKKEKQQGSRLVKIPLLGWICISWNHQQEGISASGTNKGGTSGSSDIRSCATCLSIARSLLCHILHGKTSKKRIDGCAG